MTVEFATFALSFPYFHRLLEPLYYSYRRKVIIITNKNTRISEY